MAATPKTGTQTELNNNTTTKATATLTDNTSGITYSFPYNANSVNWTYQMNTQSFSTIGGRVTQLLSARANTLTLQGEAGTRENLLNLYNQFKTVQDNQNIYKTSSTLVIPRQGGRSSYVNANVFLEQMQIGWGIDTVTYMYNMFFEIDNDLGNSPALSQAVINDALNRINNGIGFNSNYLGFTTQSVNLNLTGA